MDTELKIVNSVLKTNEINFSTASKTDTIKQIKELFNKTDLLDNLD
jgi:hypothetical protein